MLPLSLLRAATGSPLLVELKNGETYNGRLTSCDAWMNLNLTEVICTSMSGERFWKMPTCYIRGSAIKYLRLPEASLQQALDEEKEQQQQQHHAHHRSTHQGTPGRGGRGRYGERRGGGGGRGDGRTPSGRGRGDYRGKSDRNQAARGGGGERGRGRSG